MVASDTRHSTTTTREKYHSGHCHCGADATTLLGVIYETAKAATPRPQNKAFRPKQLSELPNFAATVCPGRLTTGLVRITVYLVDVGMQFLR